MIKVIAPMCSELLAAGLFASDVKPDLISACSAENSVWMIVTHFAFSEDLRSESGGVFVFRYLHQAAESYHRSV
jgi:hypothetical protein